MWPAGYTPAPSLTAELANLLSPVCQEPCSRLKPIETKHRWSTGSVGVGYEKKRIEWESKIEKYVKKKCAGCSVICSDPRPETRSNQIETDLSCYHSSLFIDVVSEVCQLLIVLPPCFCKNKHKLRGWAQNTLTHSYASILCLLDPRLLRLCQKTHYFSGAGAHCSSFEQIHMLISNTKNRSSEVCPITIWAAYWVFSFLCLPHFSGGGAGRYLPVTVGSRSAGYS